METNDWKQERILFFSDVKSFQRKKRKEGYKTRVIAHVAVAHPYFIVEYKSKIL